MDIQLANQSLLKLGATAIASVEDTKIEATVLRAFYEHTYRALLAMYPWSFAKAYAVLAQNTQVPTTDFKYSYRLPSDFITLIRVFPMQSRHQIIGNYIYCNEKTGIKIQYIKRVEESKTSVLFQDAFVLYLTTKICVPITENVQKEDSNFNQYIKALAVAKSRDAQQSTQDGMQSFPMFESRF